MKFGVILLAAGGSTRMGDQHKLLLPWGVRSVVGQALAAATQAPVQSVALVLGARAPEVLASCSPLPSHVTAVVNDQWTSGMYGSILAGLRILPADTDAFFVALGDMPLVSAAVYGALASAYRARPGHIYMPTHGGRRGHPVMLPISLAAAAPPETTDVGLRHVIQQNASLVVEVPVDNAGVCIDLDTPEQYNAHAPS